MRRLAETIEEKVPQVRRQSDGALGIMVAITEFAEGFGKRSKEVSPLVEAIRNKVLATHERMAGVFLLDHKQMKR